jgi:hypothetical protein
LSISQANLDESDAYRARQLDPARANGMKIGSRLELFIDRALIDRLDGLELKMHAPQQARPSPAPFQGHYASVIKDGQLYRAYYRGYVAGYSGPYVEGNPGEITCYAESDDGHNWEFPQLDLFDARGPDGSNVILAGEAPCSHNFSPFLDTRPDAARDEVFKALGGVWQGGKGGLFAFVSGDGLQWQRIGREPVITSRQRAFDSQNVAFWSEAESCYVCHYRTWETQHGQLRTITRVTSPDFVHWSPATPMHPNIPGEHLYTSGTHPYFRAPHIYVALPTRFVPERGGITDIMLMTSRGGVRYDRPFMEAFIRPGLDPERWQNRANYAAQNVVPTGPDEMSIYLAPNGRRYVLRTDGFASIHASDRGGEMVSNPLTFSGSELVLNYSTSAAGSIRVEIQSPEGESLPRFGLAECLPLFGDEIEGVVRWRHGGDVGALAGKEVRLRYLLKDADLFSMRFCEPPPGGGAVCHGEPAEAL